MSSRFTASNSGSAATLLKEVNNANSNAGMAVTGSYTLDQCSSNSSSSSIASGSSADSFADEDDSMNSGSTTTTNNSGNSGNGANDDDNINDENSAPPPATLVNNENAMLPTQKEQQPSTHTHSHKSKKTKSASRPVSPHADRAYKSLPVHCSDMAGEIADMFLEAERHPSYAVRSDYLTTQPEVTEKMRAIVVDWLVDVVIKFKLHPETFYLSVNVLDRYLAVGQTTRVQLQLVGITALMIASKYEEMWAPEVRECVKITANTYTRDEILRMERDICGALTFRMTVPTPYVFLSRLLQIYNAPAVAANPQSPTIDTTINNASYYFLEHAALDYGMLRFSPSHTAAAALFLGALTVTMHRSFVQLQHANVANGNGAANATLVPQAMPIPSTASIWPSELTYYAHATPAQFRPAAEQLIKFARHAVGAKYQAVRRKYSSSRLSEITPRALPEALPSDM